jgi:urate oxidase
VCQSELYNKKKEMAEPGVMTANSYGKSRVRVLKLKHGTTDDFADITVQCLLQGDGLEKAYLSADNSRIVPTDTVRQTIYILANQHPIDPIEQFAITVGKHFLEMYSWIHRADIKIEQHSWDRMQIGGAPSKQGFVKGASARRLARVAATRTSVEVRGGIEDLVLLKTGGSGFVGFNKCKHTALPEVKERMMVSAATVSWAYSAGKQPACWNKAYEAARAALLERFQDHYSPSVQYTLYRMAC